ncbi:NYN domain-containing protein [Sphingomonas sp. BGYR3]|uniref:NYN domain-containing protein n=1 Tax=Sphingomonas sp. BGYR3 TaxID=2975483 RepID=UPI0021A39C4A|nr:NYN domain-containing protein [Sphingomonas sp. BGYR3]MDG5487644.1 NYN domain-containing protein [Sphingomonas sp. BGYR3]
MSTVNGNGSASGGNVALLIDADNASPNSLDPVLTVLAELGTVNIRRVYGNWKKPALKGWQDQSLRHGLEPYQQFDITKGKNATDMRMTIDAMDLLHRGRVTGFGIMSSDSDFMPLAMRIRQDGLPVYGFGTDRTPEGFREACTRFIDVTALTDKDGSPAPVHPAKAAPVDDAELIKLLIDAYNSAKRDERGFASLTDVGQRAGNRSSFDTRNFGYARLSDLMEAVPNFQIERRDGGRVFVKRVR